MLSEISRKDYLEKNRQGRIDKVGHFRTLGKEKEKNGERWRTIYQMGQTDEKEPTGMDPLRHFRSASLSLLHAMESMVDQTKIMYVVFSVYCVSDNGFDLLLLSEKIYKNHIYRYSL